MASAGGIGQAEGLVLPRPVPPPRILPRPARWLLWAALGYLDDVLIVGGLLALVLYLIPADVREECRKAALERGRDGG